MNFRCKFRQRRSIPWPWFSGRLQNFGDLVTFSVDFFCILYAECPPYFYLRFFDQLTLKVYQTRRPDVDNSHQVWSWYDHTLPSYSVFVCWYVTWPCDLDLWPFDIEQLSYMAGHVINPATKFKEPATKRSWVTSYNGSNWLPLKMRTLPQRMLRITWPVSRGQKQLHFWNPLPRFVYSLCNFGGSTMKIIKVICENNARPALKNVRVSAHARNHVIC